MGLDEKITDLTRGVYRRQYSGYIRGKRINAISISAEAWFWRFNAAADDFGNSDATRALMYANTVGRREGVTSAQVGEWYNECITVDLLRQYESAGEPFYHVVGFLQSQPSGKNGKRVRRFPASPWDESELIQVNPDSCTKPESHKSRQIEGFIGDKADKSGIQVNPDASSAPIPIPIPTPIPIPKPKDCSKPPAAREQTKPEDVQFPEFPTSGTTQTWLLTEACIADLSATFPAVDVRSETRKAFGWIKANLSRRKTCRGMQRFLFNWLERSQNNGGSRAGSAPNSASPSQTRTRALLDARLKQ
jgi:hypothetical protein